jgi:hypothetical protein
MDSRTVDLTSSQAVAIVFFAPFRKARISSVHPEVHAYSTTPLRVMAANLFYEHRRPPFARENFACDGAARSILRLYHPYQQN